MTTALTIAGIILLSLAAIIVLVCSQYMNHDRSIF